MDKITFGAYIKEKRLEKGLTQKQLADTLLIDVTAVSKWERGVTFPDITMISDIAKSLNVSEQELINCSNDADYRADRKQARQFRKLKNSVFYTFAIAYFTAVFTCFVVNLAVSGTLSWFFVVLAGCLCGFSFMPTFTRFVNKFKFSLFTASTFFSLVILFVTVCVYTKTSWWGMATAGVALGYFVVFAPCFAVKSKAYLSDEKYQSIKRFFALIYVVCTAVLTDLLLIIIRISIKMNLMQGLKISGYCFVLPLAYAVVEIIKTNRLLKLSIDSFLTAPFLFGLNGVMHLILEGKLDGVYKFNLQYWTDDVINGNVCFIVTFVFVLAGAVMLVTNILLKTSNKTKK